MLPGNCLHEIFAARVREAPNRVAVTAGDRQATYAELDSWAGRLAGHLRGLGVGPETLVGLCGERGIPLIAGMLGILKAGGAYVPVDPAYPDERIRLLLSGSGIRRVVTVGAAASRIEGTGAQVVRMEELAAVAPTPVDLPVGSGRNLAYVIHTSGSTGAPKGVLVEHRNAVRLFTSTALWFRFDHRDVWTLFHSPSFDFSVWEIWGALLHGGRLVVVPSGTTRRPAELLALLRSEGVTVLNQTPSAFRQLVGALEPDTELSLRHVIFGGERLDVAMLRPWLDRYGDAHPRLVNMYGITETTVHVTYRRIRHADLDHPGRSPIGVAIPDLRVTLHDEAGRQVPGGTPGEMWVFGGGVARGYLNRPDLTEQRFVTALDGVRGYRSGDLAVRTAHGDLLYLGRIDDQLQVRGHRVEPYEVEACLCAHPSVAAAVVTAREYPDGDVRLVAYVLPSNGTDRAALVGALSRHAAAHLPAYLRPTHYEPVASLPMTANGKVDRTALLGKKEAITMPIELTTASAVKVIGQIVAEVLERDHVAPDDDVFDLGATSLMFIRIVAEVNTRFRVSLNGSEVGDIASIAALAVAVTAATASPAPAAV